MSQEYTMPQASRWTFAGLAALLACAFLPAHGAAQTTDGYHAIQILPIVVDSASFSTEVILSNATDTTIYIIPRYVPATGTSQPTMLTCPGVSVFEGESKSASLRQLCPDLAAGSQFGYLYLAADLGVSSEDRSFAAYARVSNPQGNGFSVEGFPAHAFTSADTVVNGLRRLQATGSAPAFQSNCFIGNLHDLTAPAQPPVTTITYQVYDDFFQIGAGEVQLVPGKLVRLLDVFQAAGMPPGDYPDARVKFSESGEGEPALVTFCTVQDNTSFGADFRIGKQLMGQSAASLVPSPYAQDDHALRRSRIGQDLALSNGAGQAVRRPFTIPAGSTGNTHLLAARHPDRISCSLHDPLTGNGYVPGLEMRLMAPDGITVLAGGNDVGSFSGLYLGDKTDRGLGANTYYTLEVESAETNTGIDRPYQLECRSGSGHGPTPLLRTNVPNQF